MRNTRSKLDNITRKITYMEDKKAERAKRMLKFKREILPALEGYDVESLNNGTMFKFYDQKYGYIDFYPMADKLMINNGAKWIKDAARWIIKNVFWEDIN